MSWQFQEFPNASALHSACAQALEQHIRLGLAERGGAVLALAGGSTPLPVYRLLAKAELDWQRVSIVPTDERWVAESHLACNLGQLKACFAGCPGIRWLSLVPALPDPQALSAEHAATVLADMALPFDAVLLGMGLDGHTASLFPGAPQLSEALALDSPLRALAMTPEPLPPEAPYPRVTLSAAYLLHSRVLLLAITGAQKRVVLEAAQDRDSVQLPISRLLHAAGKTVDICSPERDATVSIFWSP